MSNMPGHLSAALADRYRIEREVGAGGMATVYLAHDVRHDRRVAVKVLRPELAAALGSERFLKEIHTTANLQHPHILPLFDSGEAHAPPDRTAERETGGADQGSRAFLYYVMPYIEGESLRQRLNRGRPDLDDVVTIAKQVAGALDYAHGKGVVHRDIKPENVLLQHGLALVADFGIALAVGKAGAERLTETGTSLGTPAYMSPEQVAGDRAVTAASDVYSLGCLVFEMLVGEPPYAAPTSAAMIARRFTEPIPTVGDDRPDLPRQVDGVLARALAQDPAQRYRAAGALAAALETALRAAPPVRAPSQRKSIVVLPFDNMSPDPSDAYLGDGLTEELTSKLSKLGSLRVMSRTSAMQLKKSDKEIATIARELDVQYVLEGSVRKAGNALRITAQLIDGPNDEHLWSESYSGTIEDVFGMQEKVSLAIVDALKVELSPQETKQLEERPFQSFQAFHLYVQARADALLGGEDALDRALATLGVALATEAESELLLVARGLVLFQLVNGMLKPATLHAGFLDEANQCAERALALNPNSAGACTVKGFVLHARGDLLGSMRQFVKARSLDPNNLEALLILGYYRAAEGWDLQGARDILLKLERLDPLTPLNTGALGWLLWFQGEFRAALSRFQPFWDAMGKGHPWLLLRAYFEAASGDVDTAIQTVRTMQAEAPQHLLTQLGGFLVHAWRGERAEALAAVTEDIETAARWDDIWPLFLAAGYSLIGEKDRAFHWLDEVVGHGVCNVAYLHDYDPFLANLRSDPRFSSLMQQASDLSASLQEVAARATGVGAA